MKNKLILLLDGNFYAWRAYATRNLKTSTGIPTSVISGMLQTIRTAFSKFNYDRLVICWDGKGGSKFRKELFPAYKANREDSRKKHAGLFKQMISARDFFKALDVRQAIMRGIEGDDIIGMLSRFYSDNHRVIIASADKDLLQLITKRVKVFRPITDELIGIKEFKKQYDGLLPIDLIKIKSLTGDKGDNVPGINGIGDKGAIAIVKQFRTLESIKVCRTTDRKVLLVRKNIKAVNLAYKLVKIICQPSELENKDEAKFIKIVGNYRGGRFVDPITLIEQLRHFELKHRNYDALASQLTIKLKRI